MQFAVNYSPQAVALLTQNQIALDRFKCPAWDDVIATAQETHPVYVHFPLRVGMGISDAIDTERDQPADWRRIESLVKQTDTPYVNLHLTPVLSDFLDLAGDTNDPAARERLVEAAVRDIEAVVRRFGADKVIVENDYYNPWEYFCLTCHPEYVRQVIEAAGCGMLLDIAHARLAARAWKLDPRDYIAALPVDRICEIHLAGIQYVDESWQTILRTYAPQMLEYYAGSWMDHLPMTEEAFSFYTWAFEQLRSGAWQRPWIVSLEYGGVGALWQALTDEKILSEHVPRLYALLHDL